MHLNIHKYFRYILIFLSLFLSLIIPRSKNIIVFGSRDGKRFADNSRYLFVYLNKFTNKKIIWLTKSNKIKNDLLINNYKCYFSSSFFGLYYGFRAKYHIFDYSENDTSELTSIKAIKVNLGHGTYIKKVSKYKIDNIISKIYNFLINNKNNFHTYPNKIYAHHILDYFPKKKYNLVLSNHPRNVVFYGKNNSNDYFFTHKEKKLIRKIKTIKGKVIGYFPTHRKKGYDLFYDVNSVDKLNDLNNLLKKNNSYIITKHHSNIFKEDNFTLLHKKNNLLDIALKDLSNFINLDYDMDLNSILNNCDLLVSDYSGAIADYLISNKPIILYTPDYNDYSFDPGLNFNYKTYVFGHMATNYETLMRYLSIYLLNPFEFSKRYSQKRIRIKKILFKDDDCFNEIIKKIN